MDVLRNSHPPEDHRRLGPGVEPGDDANGLRRDAADRRHLLGCERRQMPSQRREAFGVFLDVLLIVEPLGDDHVHHCVEQRDIGPGDELKHVGRMSAERLAARVHHDQGLAGLGRVLEECRRHRVVHRRVGADDDDDLGVRALEERRGDSARIDSLHQGGNRRGVA